MLIRNYVLLEEAGAEGSAGGGGEAVLTPEEQAARLEAPAGTEFDAPKPTEGGEGGEGTTETPEQIETRETAEREANNGKTLAEIEAEKSTGGDGTANTDTFTPNAIWEHLKSVEGVEIPDEITAENEKELYQKVLNEKFGIKPEADTNLHPFAKQVQDAVAKNPNATINDIFGSMQEQVIDVSKMTADEKIGFDLKARFGEYDEEKNVDGVTDADIEEHIKGLTKVQKNELLVNIDKNIEDYNNRIINEKKETDAATYEDNYNKYLEDQKKYIDKIKLATTTMDNVYGIPVNQETHKGFLEQFEQAVTPNKETGERLIDELLSNDDLLYKFFVLAANGEDKVRELITKGKESGKEEILKKLELTQNNSGARRTGDNTMSQEEMARKLAEPDNS